MAYGKGQNIRAHGLSRENQVTAEFFFFLIWESLDPFSKEAGGGVMREERKGYPRRARLPLS